MQCNLDGLHRLLEENRQGHLLRFWETLDDPARALLAEEIRSIDFRLMNRLIDQWVLHEPAPEVFSRIEPVPMIPRGDPNRADAREAWDAGEDALRAGRVGLFLVAGGQGTRLGFDGPKGAYPIGPVSKRSFFHFHAEKILNLQNRYGCTLPWYIMVSDANEADTRAFFARHHYFGLQPEDVYFLKQRMVPCVDETGKFMLDTPGRLAMNPNGHGGCLPAMVERGVVQNARERGVDMLSYFQVDNWTVKVADPYLIGYHVLRNAGMSSKNHRKNQPREAVGVHCLCDAEYRVIEYSELDIYPQLLQTDADGNLLYAAGNSAMHVLSLDFVEEIVKRYDEFPWHRAHKKIPFINEKSERVLPVKPNAYKFETFIFDALRFIRHAPVALEIARAGEYTPIKSFEGDNSVLAAWERMNDYWAEWIEAAGHDVPRDPDGHAAIRIEISPQFALTQDEFLQKIAGRPLPKNADIAIAPNGELITPLP